MKRHGYWYLLPLSIPSLWTFFAAWRRSEATAAIGFTVMTAIFAAIGWLNERLVVPLLRQERARVKSLYDDGGA